MLFSPGEPLPAVVETTPDSAARGVGIPGHLFAISLALIGGVLGILGAVVQEMRTSGFLLLFFLGAPIIEEGLKPAGVYVLLARWPRLLRGRLHTALLAALGGLTFGVIEAIVYVKVYVSDPSDRFIAYRFTLPLLLHATGSFLVGLGLNRGLVAWANGEAPLPKSSRNFFIAAVTLHAVFNLSVTVLSLAGVLDLS